MAVVNYLTIDGEIVSETRNGAVSDYIPDPLGNVAKILNTSQQITDSFVYWPYGEVKSHSGSNPTPFQFVGSWGYYSDLAGTRVYVRARSYQPTRTCWAQLDPAWPLEPQYGYASGCPSTRPDPGGQQCQVGPWAPSFTPPIDINGLYPVPPAWPGPWPPGCPHPKPGKPKPVGPRPACNAYLAECHAGSILACNMYYVCTGAGGILPPISGPGADCVRGCLLGVYGPASLASCRCAYAQHQQCFHQCGWAPPWPFNWATWSFVCDHHVPGAPDPGKGAWPTP